MSTFKVGSVIKYRPGFGSGAPRNVTIIGIERVEIGKKYGDPVMTGSTTDKRYDYVLDLDDGHWAYSRQIVHVFTNTKTAILS